MADSQKKTAQLFDKTSFVTNGNRVRCTAAENSTGFTLTSTESGDCYIGTTGKAPATATTAMINQSFEVKANTQYTLHLSSSPWCFIAYIAENGDFINTDYINLPARSEPMDYNFTTPDNCKYVLFRIGMGVVDTGDSLAFTDVMLNEGTTALPYEPYSSTGWLHSLRKLTTATEAVENPLYSDGTPITSYTLKGNTVQDGTPTPSNPVMPNGVGVRTKNLYKNVLTGSTYFSVAFTNDTQILTITALRTTTSGNIWYVDRIADELLENGARYYILSTNISGVVSSLRLQLRNKDGSYAGFDTSNTVVYDDTYGMFVVGNPFGGSSVEVTEGQQAVIQNILVVKHGETTDYEPYGYKIPISSGQQTTNIYLGSTQSERKIYKWEFTGNEAWNINDVQGSRFFYVAIPSAKAALSSSPRYCSHFTEEETFINPAGAALRIYDQNSAYADTTAFKAFLASQYTNGTPVTLWYILETPETATLDEPLMKIGTYADTLSNATAIPTTEGANSITVDTTVQPSEFTATWTGWHDATVKEKSENLAPPLSAWVDGYINTSGEISSASETRVEKASPYIDIGSATIIAYSYNSIDGYFPEGSENQGWRAIGCYSADKTFLARIGGNGRHTIVTTEENALPPTTKYIRLTLRTYGEVNGVMLNEGSTALPYEPYWK